MAIISAGAYGIVLSAPKGVFVMSGCWKLSLLVALASVVSTSRSEELLPPEKSVEEAIDNYIDARLAKENVTAAAQAGDVNVLRRTMLDLVGRIPTAAEAKTFAASTDANKRIALV